MHKYLRETFQNKNPHTAFLQLQVDLYYVLVYWNNLSSVFLLVILAFSLSVSSVFPRLLTSRRELLGYARCYEGMIYCHSSLFTLTKLTEDEMVHSKFQLTTEKYVIVHVIIMNLTRGSLLFPRRSSLLPVRKSWVRERETVQVCAGQNWDPPGVISE